MEIIRRNTDYALRMMVNLALNRGEGFVSSRALAEQGGISHPLACKLLQKLNAAGLLKSSLGANGGFMLGRPPSRINLAKIIEVIQGPILVNRCILGKAECPRQPDCPITRKLCRIQEYINKSLGQVTLLDLLA